MTPFQPAHIDATEIERTADALLKKWEAGDATARALLPSVTRRGDAMEHIREIVKAEANRGDVFLNDTYQVIVAKLMEDQVHLSIKRIDRQPIHDWRDLQEIKNQLVGPECEALELYPAESRRVDAANQYHLWCCTDDNFRFPFGFHTRAVGDEPIGKSVNRPLE